MLIAHGRNPRVREMAIFAHAHQPGGQSVTGADQVPAFGKAVYDFMGDRVRFESE